MPSMAPSRSGAPAPSVAPASSLAPAVPPPPQKLDRNTEGKTWVAPSDGAVTAAHLSDQEVAGAYMHIGRSTCGGGTLARAACPSHEVASDGPVHGDDDDFVCSDEDGDLQQRLSQFLLPSDGSRC